MKGKNEQTADVIEQVCAEIRKINGIEEGEMSCTGIEFNDTNEALIESYSERFKISRSILEQILY